MGHYTRVTQAISRLSRRPGRKLEKMKRQLMALRCSGQPDLLSNVTILGLTPAELRDRLLPAYGHDGLAL